MSLFAMVLPLCALVAVWGLASPQGLASAATTVTSTIFQSLDWFFMLSVSGFVALSLSLAVSPVGKVKLGRPEDQPEFSTGSWLAMLFSAGIGGGLLFWGVAEPIIHFMAPPAATGGTPDAARAGMVLTGMHWGIHAWSIYCVGALVLAYFGFRHGAPYLAGAPLRAAFRGRWVEPLARAADLIAVLAGAFGVAGSIALGIMQLQSGLDLVTDRPLDSLWVTAAILGLLMVCYVLSAMTSIDKGIKLVSNANVALSVALMLFVLLAGPTGYLLRNFVTGLGDYLSHFVQQSLRLFPYQDEVHWLRAWTLNYFILWISWAPFVGIFIARISRGRTIRELVLAVLFAPTVFSLLWFSIFGGTAFFEEMLGFGGIAQVVREDVTIALFTLFDRLPFSSVPVGLSLLLVFTFQVTSVDSATFVLSMLTSRGSLEPPVGRRLAWGASVGALGGALILAEDVQVIRSIAVAGAIPFTFILLLQIAAMLRMMRLEADAARLGSRCADGPEDNQGGTTASQPTVRRAA
jgi:glycine betaine transporter